MSQVPCSHGCGTILKVPFAKRPTVKKPRHYQHFDPETVLAIYKATGRQVDIAEQFSVTKTRVNSIKNGNHYTEITGHPASRVKRKRAP